MDGKNITTTASQRLDAGITLLFKNLPTLSVNYLPVYFTQKIINETTFKYYGRAENFNVSSSYTTRIDDHNLSSTALFTHSVNENVFIKQGFDLYTYMLCENFALTKSSGLRTILTYNNPGNHNDSLRSFITDVSTSFPLLKRGTQILGFKLNKNNIANQYFVYCQTNLQIKNHLSCSLYLFHNLNNKTTNPTTYQPSGNLVQVSLTAWW